MEPEPYLRDSQHGAVLQVHAVPGAKHTEIRGEYGGRLKIAVKAPPEDGRANEELLNYLAKRCRVKAELVHGASSRRKTIRLEGLSAQAAAELLRSE